MHYHTRMSLSLWIVLLACAAAPGDWPEPRHDGHLLGLQPLPGEMREAPVPLARYDVGSSAPTLTPVALPDGAVVGLCIVAGALHCYGTDGSLKWSSHPRASISPR